MSGETLWLALALMLVIEGLLPFLSPARWRQLFVQMIRLQDGQIRFFGLCSMTLGLLGLWWLS